jgi:hypothetical protein
MDGAPGRAVVDLAHYLEDCERVLDPAREGPAGAEARDHVTILRAPRSILSGILPHRRLRRAHGGEHAIESQTLGAVASTEAVHLELSLTTKDLEREEVLPLRTAHVQPGDLTGRRRQQQEGIVLDRHPPEKRLHVAAHLGEVPGKPSS